MKTAADVLAGRERFAVECADAVAWLRSLPDDSVDLLVTSPPYEKARTYGIGDKMLAGQAGHRLRRAAVSGGLVLSAISDGDACDVLR